MGPYKKFFLPLWITYVFFNMSNSKKADHVVTQLDCIAMGQCKKDVTPLLTHWSYIFLALTHWFADNNLFGYYTTTKLLGGILVSLRPPVCPSVHPSRLPCPLCNIYSSGWILSILATNDHYDKRVCHTQWPLTLTYIFKVIRPWLRKSCPLCSV